MKKFMMLLMAVMLTFSLTACGGGGGGGGGEEASDDPCVGTWISVAGSMMGMTLTGDDISGFEFVLESNGDATLNVDGDSGKGDWSSDGSNVTITVEGTDMVGVLGEDGDTIVFENMMDMGMELTFAREGSAAADPSLYIPEEEKAMIGLWTSNAVTDILGDPVSNMAADALVMDFKADKTVQVTFNGQDLGVFEWSNFGTWGSLDSGNEDISWDILDTGLEVTYVIDGEYYIFTCSK